MINSIVSLFILLFFNLHLKAAEISWAKEQTSGQTVEANNAIKENGPFLCLKCNKELILKKGLVRIPHFAHKYSENNMCTGGSTESLQHLKAKQLLSENLNEWKFVTECSGCHTQISHCSKTFLAHLGHEGKIEYPFDAFIVDVMIVRNTTEVAALEVKFTHAVDKNKRAFFISKNIPIIEVDAEQIIEAYENKSFIAKVIEQKFCPSCEQTNRRPCLQCKNWYSPEVLSTIIPPAGHAYTKAFVCNHCKAMCPSCHKTSTAAQINDHTMCFGCDKKSKDWNIQVKNALQTKNIGQMAKLLNTAPTNVDTQCLRTNYEKLKREHSEREALRKAQELEIKQQHEEAVLNQWKLNVDQAIEKKDCEEMKNLLKEAPLHGDIQEECEIIRQQLIEQEPIWQSLLLEKAQEILLNNKIDLKVPHEHSEQIRKLGGQWYGGKSWTVSPHYIESCSRWFSGSKELIPIVKDLLRKKALEHKPKQAKKRARNTTPPAPKRQRITHYFTKTKD